MIRKRKNSMEFNEHIQRHIASEGFRFVGWGICLQNGNFISKISTDSPAPAITTTSKEVEASSWLEWRFIDLIAVILGGKIIEIWDRGSERRLLECHSDHFPYEEALQIPLSHAYH